MGYPLISLVHRDEPSLTGVCWLSPRVSIPTALYSLAPQGPPEKPAQPAVEIAMQTAAHTLTGRRMVR